MTKHKVRLFDIVFILFFCFAFLSRPLDLTYMGEIYLVVCVLLLVISILKNKKIDKDIFMILLTCLLLGLWGIFCNSISDIERTPMMIGIDFVTQIKVFICFFSIHTYLKRRENAYNQSILKGIGVLSRIITVIAFICFIINHFLPLNMTGDLRYGMHSYKFIFNSGGWFSQGWMIIPLVLTANLEFSKNKLLDEILLLISLFLWAFSLRARAFVMIALYFALFFFLSNKNKDKDFKEKFFNLKTIGIMIILVALLGYDQMSNYYLSEDSTARSLLLKGGISTMKEYFPAGSGFATYGTEMAKKYYSPLYYRYGVNAHWALQENGTELTDCYWPAVGAELGLLGIILVSTMIIRMFKVMINKSKENKYLFICAIIEIVYLVISSTATGIFSSDITALYISIVALIINSTKERIDNDENKYLV